MNKRLYFIDKELGMIYPRFWIRCLIWIILAIVIFWYTSAYWFNFNALIFQKFATTKFAMILIGTSLVGEWIFYTCKLVCDKIDIRTNEKKFLASIIVFGLIIPYVYLYVVAKFFELSFGSEIIDFIDLTHLLIVFLLIAILSMVNIAHYLIQQSSYFYELKVNYGNQKVKLKIRDVAYLFCHHRDYYITNHSGITYKSTYSKDIKQFYSLLNPIIFFMVNDHTIISRKACKGYTEDRDGNLRLNLEPKPIIPEPLRGQQESGLFDVINYN